MEIGNGEEEEELAALDDLIDSQLSEHPPIKTPPKPIVYEEVKATP